MDVFNPFDKQDEGSPRVRHHFPVPWFPARFFEAFGKQPRETSVSTAGGQGTSGRTAPISQTEGSEVTSTKGPSQAHTLTEAVPVVNDKYYLCTFEQADFFEYFEAKFHSSVSSIDSNVKGRLRQHCNFWEKIGANCDIIDVIKHGYKIPFLETPACSFSYNNRSALSNSEFVNSSIDEMVKCQYIVETPFKPVVVNPLSVSINKSGKKRLILDLRLVNRFIWKEKITFEDWRVALEYFRQDCYCFKFDLSKGYYHLDIFPEHQTFLGFSFNGKYYCYTVVPFGLCSAPFIFTKVLREMVKYWRSYGIKIVMFLDDGWGTNDNLRSTLEDSEFVKSSLVQAGFVSNNDKSIWEPVKSLEWIGIWWDSKSYSISIPQRRVDECQLTIQSLMVSLPIVSARALAVCAGKLISMIPVLGNIARLMTRFLYKEIENRHSWDFKYSIQGDNACLTELRFWLAQIDNVNCRPLTEYKPTQTIVYSDASQSGCGAFIVESNVSVFHDTWSNEDARGSSTYREIKAVRLALRAYGQLLANSSVKWFSDSQTCVHVVKVGSTNLELQNEALSIMSLCTRHNIDLDIQWVPRSENVIADNISKIRDTDEWEVSGEFFSFMERHWGPYDVDRFASYRNRKTVRYNSKFYDFETDGVDAFTQDWSAGNNWLVPPIRLVNKAIFHLLSCRGRGTLIVPKWPSASFWPVLFHEGYVKKDFIQEILEFRPNQGIFVNSVNSKCVFDSRRFCSHVLAIRF